MGQRSDIRFRVLGPLEVTVRDRVVLVPAGQMRTLLASLLLAVGGSVPVDELAERLWPDRLPKRVRAAVHTYVARLRRLLGHDLVETTPGGGYQLALAAEQVDLWRFRDLLQRSRAVGSAAAELAMLQEALGLWRGRPFLDIDSTWLRREVIPRLVDEWFTAVERRIDLELGTAPPGNVIAELRALIAEEPTRESLWLRLIDALHRSGRRVEALDAYQQVRTILGDKPIIITSGYRCYELNVACGGAENSAHLHGLACDFVCPEFGTPLDICGALEPHMAMLGIDQLIWEYEGWVHLGLTAGDPRCQCLTINDSGTTTGFA